MMDTRLRGTRDTCVPPPVTRTNAAARPADDALWITTRRVCDVYDMITEFKGRFDTLLQMFVCVCVCVCVNAYDVTTRFMMRVGQCVCL